MNKITPPLKYHGGKHYLAQRIIELMPPRESKGNPGGWCHYVEPYFGGGGAVLFENDPEGISEVVNDIDHRLMNFWACLACPPSFAEFERRAQAVPFSEEAWRGAAEKLCASCDAPDTICISCALAFFVYCRQSLAGRMACFAPLSKTRTRRGMNEQASAWLNAVEGLPAVHNRMKRVAMLYRMDALAVIRQQDGPKTLFYCDPPYCPDTRTAPDVYAHEMTREQHEELLKLLLTIQGRFLLSGYPDPLYHQYANQGGWKEHAFTLPNNAAGGDTKRRMTECVWCNFG